MLLHFMLFAGVVGANGGTDRPACPDFGALIPQAPATLPANERDRWEASQRDAVLLAKWLDRAWNSATTLDELSKYLLNLSTVALQLDDLLAQLNPNPTVTEAVARVRAYQSVIALIRHRLKLAETDGLEKWQLDSQSGSQWGDQLERLLKNIEQRYRPLFARSG